MNAPDRVWVTLPFFMMVLMAKGFIVATPFIVRAISGNIMMPALADGLWGSYDFARTPLGNQQAYNRYLVGGASGAEYAAAARDGEYIAYEQQVGNRYWVADDGAVGAAWKTGTAGEWRSTSVAM